MTEDSDPSAHVANVGEEIGHDRTGARLTLHACAEADCEAIARALAAIDPWARLGIDAQVLTTFFESATHRRHAHEVKCEGKRAAVLVINPNWLFGPYIQTFAVFDGFQRRGIGTVILSWTIARARHSSRNIWVCCSAFNTSAVRFYERAGFERAALLDGLVVDHEDEVLLRLRCRSAA